MGGVASRIAKEERVRICKERKKLMKQLLGYRKEFADAQSAYLRSLRNTGVTLRQFTESESLELEETTSGVGYPSSPPPPLPPSPPPPPPPPAFSPDSRKSGKTPPKTEIEEIIESDEDNVHTPPPPIPSSSWEYWDVFGSALPNCEKSGETVDQVEDESWEDTNTEFVEENEEEIDMLTSKKQISDILDDNDNDNDNSSMVSWHTKDTTSDMAMVVWRGKKSLSGVVKEMDEYFLKASAVVKDIAVFIDIDAGGTFLYQSVKENKRKRSNSKVFSALTWSWASKSHQSTRETGDLFGSNEPCKPGAHCITLQRLHTEEQKLYKNVKEEEISKVEYGRKSSLLQRQEEEHDWTKAEKTRSTVESLHTYILSLQESIGKSYSTLLTLISKELHPQLITLSSGLKHMWQTMHNCHQVQSHISQHLNNIADQQNLEPTSEYHQQAAVQLQTEVTSWYHSFCKLVKYQREYVRALCKWAELTNCLEDSGGRQSCNELLTVHALAEKWLQALDKLPDKIVSDAIKCLLSSVHAIVVQQHEECNMRKRSEKLGKKLERERILLSEVEMKFAGNFSIEEANSVVASKHPLTIRRAKVEALKILVQDEKAKYVNSIKTTRVMILTNLQTSLPKVFQALEVYSSSYAHGFEEILGNATVSETGDVHSAV